MSCIVLDLVSRFADGRLSTRKLLEADDEELHRMLTEVRGIGAVSSINIDGIMFRICSCHVYSGQVRQAVTQTISLS